MGYWNETCALSHLPIQEDELITAVILMRVSDDFHACKTYTNYSPVCLPVDCEYDGYGRITEPVALEYTDRLLRAYCEYGTISYADFEVYSYISFEQLVKDIQESDLYFNYLGIQHKLEVAYYLRGLYQKICAGYGASESFAEPISNAEKYQQAVPVLVRTAKRYLEVKHKLKDSGMVEEFYALSDTLQTYFFKVCRISEFSIFLKDYLETLSDVEIPDFFDVLKGFVLFVNALNTGRYSFNSTCGAGSQSCDCFVQRLVAEYILEYTEQMESSES